MQELPPFCVVWGVSPSLPGACSFFQSPHNGVTLWVKWWVEGEGRQARGLLCFVPKPFPYLDAFER